MYCKEENSKNICSFLSGGVCFDLTRDQTNRPLRAAEVGLIFRCSDNFRGPFYAFSLWGVNIVTGAGQESYLTKSHDVFAFIEEGGEEP